MGSGSLMILCAIPLFYLFLSLFILNRDAHLTKYQSQIFQAVFVWFIVAIVQIVLAEDRRPQSLIPVIPPTSFFLTHFLLLIRRRKVAELNLVILLVAIVTVAYLSRYKKIDRIKYDEMIVKEAPSPIKQKRILVLDNQPSLFVQNKLATPFYDW